MADGVNTGTVVDRELRRLELLLILWVVAVVAVVVVAEEADVAAGDHCDRLLHRASSGKFVEVMLLGEPVDVVVRLQPGSGRALRAFGAMLVAIARRMRYAHIHLRPRGAPDPGEFTYSGARNEISVFAAAAVEPAAPRLHVRLAAQASRCLAATVWTFYADENNLRNCTFLRMSDIGAAWGNYERIETGEESECAECAVVLAAHGARWAAAELQRRAIAHRLLLRVVVADLLRPRPPARSVLFFDELLLWAGEPNVHGIYPPPCLAHLGASCALHLGYSQAPMTITFDSALIRKFAPQLYDAFKRFIPTAADIRDVLKLESVNGNNTEDAACEWFLQNSKRLDGLFQSPLPKLTKANVVYKIRLFLCREDPDRAEYQQIFPEILKLIDLKGLLVEIKNESIMCLDGNALHEKFMVLLNNNNEHYTIAWIATGVGTSKIEDIAEGISLPIVSYDTPPIALRPNSVVRAVTGSMRVLARGYLHLWAQCGISRIAVISDRTSYSRDLMAILSENNLNIRHVNVSSGESITLALREFRAADARAFFVNAKADIAAEVLCAAREAGMSAEHEYLWWVREWRRAGACGPSAALSLGLSWRGADGAERWPAGPAGAEGAPGAVRRALDSRWPRRAWPPLATPLADAVLLLAQTLASYIERNPENIDDRHLFGDAK
ncbi:unnamed protein product, partial [Iphiclides podalirius]